MGKILQIRVSAWTYREEDVPKTWPNLVALAWPTQPYSGEKRGVLELVAALDTGFSFQDWPNAIKTTLQTGIHDIVTTKKNLEIALADWKPVEANLLSNTLEDQLTELEDQLTER